MNLIKKQVIHKYFGKGSVIGQDETSVEIHFSSGDKKFIYPDAFENFLTLTDTKAAESVSDIIVKKTEDRRVKELELELEKELERKEQEELLERIKLQTNFKIHPCSQAAFWCKEDEIEDTFTNWSISTGTIKSGINEGKPNKPVRLHSNSACLLTQRKQGSSEKGRRIIGLFMVEDKFVGKLCDDGIIPSNPKYRLRLSEDESEKILFWNYYINEKYPDNTTWNTGRYRYFDNLWMAQILKDIVDLKKDQPDLEEAQNFFDHFCVANQIKKMELTPPSGALIRK